MTKCNAHLSASYQELCSHSSLCAENRCGALLASAEPQGCGACRHMFGCCQNKGLEYRGLSPCERGTMKHFNVCLRQTVNLE